MKSRNKCILAFCLFLLMMLCFTGCGNTNGGNEQNTASSTVKTESTQQKNTAAEETAAQTEGENGKTTKGAQNGRVLVACFSATGTTKPIAEYAAKLTGADLFEIVPAEAYTAEDLNYSDDNCRANKEQNDSTARPEIAADVENMDDYDIVLLGHPIWWGIEPRIMDTFVESYDLSGKTVVNFCTSGGSGISAAASNLEKLAPDANWLEGHRFQSNASENDVREWLESLDLNIELN